MQKQQRRCHPGPLDVETLNFSLGVNSLKWNIWGFGAADVVGIIKM